jgi:hypothetical protein
LLSRLKRVITDDYFTKGFHHYNYLQSNIFFKGAKNSKPWAKMSVNYIMTVNINEKALNEKCHCLLGHHDNGTAHLYVIQK